MTTRLAVIPARGGSTRLKDKNVQPIAGKPLICYTIEAVLDSGCFDTVVVSTDGAAIAAQARKYAGVEIYDRPAEYAGARVTVVDALLAMMADFRRHDVFAYFLPTCPFRSAADVAQGIALLSPEVDSVISICAYSEPPQLALLKKGNDIIPVFDNLTAGITNSKYITKYYKPNGGFYMGWWDRLLTNRNFFTGNVKGVELPKERSIDIDDALDLVIAEEVLKHAQRGAPAESAGRIAA